MAEDTFNPADSISLARPTSLLRHLRYVLKAMRPRQWTKNGIVFMALIFSVNQEWMPEDFSTWDDLLLRCIVTALAFCAVSGAEYMVNDLMDRESDRLHPKKRNRPIAAGLLGAREAVVWAVVLAAAGIVAAYLIDWRTGAVVAGYAGLMLAYTFYLNETAINATLTFGGRQYPMVQAGNRWWTVIGVGAFTSPGLAPVTVAYTPAQGAAVRSITQSLSITDRDYPVSHITLDPATASLLAPDIVNNEIAQRAAIFSGYTAQKLWNGAFQRPAEGPLSDRYGEGRSYNGSPVTDYHKGTDFVGGIGDPVYAAAAGRVVFTGELRVRGNAIIIDHGLGVFTAYHHLSAIKVVQGAIVAPGQRIGDIGSTGLVTGPHLHWEVIVRGVEVDGEYWLSDISLGP
jgi:hypothetical protein